MVTAQGKCLERISLCLRHRDCGFSELADSAITLYRLFIEARKRADDTFLGGRLFDNEPATTLDE